MPLNIQSLYTETPCLYPTERLRWNTTTLSHRVSSLKHHDFILRVSSMKIPYFIVQAVFDETPWLYRTGRFRWNVLTSSYRVSSMKRPDFIIQSVFDETPWFWKCFKNMQIVFLGVQFFCFYRSSNYRLHFRVPRGQPLGRNKGVHTEPCRFFQLHLSRCVTGICE
jgi:hypothetical protein